MEKFTEPAKTVAEVIPDMTVTQFFFGFCGLMLLVGVVIFCGLLFFLIGIKLFRKAVKWLGLEDEFNM